MATWAFALWVKIVTGMQADRDLAWQLVETETRLIQRNLPANEQLRRALIVDLSRELDVFRLSSNRDALRYLPLLSLGWAKGLSLMLSSWSATEYDNLPLRPSTPDSQRYALALLMRLGGLAALERMLNLQRDNLVSLSVENGTIKISFGARYYWIENAEAEAYAGLLGVIRNSEMEAKGELEQEWTGIREQMTQLVYVWRGHYIGYNSHPAVDEYYHRVANLQVASYHGWDNFSGDAVFGGVGFHTYRHVTELLIEAAIKHAGFASVLLGKVPDLRVRNLLTVLTRRSELAKNFAQSLAAEEQLINQALECCTVTHEDVQGDYLSRPLGPNIDLGNGYVIRSLTGSLASPFDFLTKKLKAAYPRDYFVAVNEREQTFRSELYELFMPPRFLRAEKPINIGGNGAPKTDIDAVVLDTLAGTLGLFQLKWQDTFGDSPNERRSRLSNMVPKAQQWADRINASIKDGLVERVTRSLGFDSAKNPKILRVHVFVLGRNSGNFSGDSPPKPGVAWGSWAQVLRLFAEGNLDPDSLLDSLYETLIRESPYNQPPPEFRPFEFTVGDTKVVLFEG